MFRQRFVHISIIFLQVCIFAILFIPFITIYGETFTTWDLIVQSFNSNDISKLLSISWYYISPISTLTFLGLFAGYFKYVISAVFASFSLGSSLIFYIFPALEAHYLFETYQVGFYLSISFQFLTILLSAVAVNLGTNKSKNIQFSSNKDTEEILMEDIKKQIKNLG